MRLIDADAMRDDWLENGENEYVYDTNAVLANIDEQPTIDAVPVVHGMWSDEYTERYVCTVCGCWFFIDSGDGNMNYCPNCGAKMDGGAAE